MSRNCGDNTKARHMAHKILDLNYACRFKSLQACKYLTQDGPDENQKATDYIQPNDINLVYVCRETRGHREPQQKNIELHTFSCSLGSWGTGTGPADVIPPWLEDVSDASSNLMNDPTWLAAR